MWQEDSDAAACALCHRAFGLLRRRHHCRNCGKIVDAACSRNKRPSSHVLLGMPHAKLVPRGTLVRVCDACALPAQAQRQPTQPCAHPPPNNAPPSNAPRSNAPPSAPAGAADLVLSSAADRAPPAPRRRLSFSPAYVAHDELLQAALATAFRGSAADTNFLAKPRGVGDAGRGLYVTRLRCRRGGGDLVVYTTCNLSNPAFAALPSRYELVAVTLGDAECDWPPLLLTRVLREEVLRGLDLLGCVRASGSVCVSVKLPGASSLGSFVVAEPLRASATVPVRSVRMDGESVSLLVATRVTPDEASFVFAGRDNGLQLLRMLELQGEPSGGDQRPSAIPPELQEQLQYPRTSAKTVQQLVEAIARPETAVRDVADLLEEQQQQQRASCVWAYPGILTLVDACIEHERFDLCACLVDFVEKELADAALDVLPWSLWLSEPHEHAFVRCVIIAAKSAPAAPSASLSSSLSSSSRAKQRADLLALIQGVLHCKLASVLGFRLPNPEMNVATAAFCAACWYADAELIGTFLLELEVAKLGDARAAEGLGVIYQNAHDEQGLTCFDCLCSSKSLNTAAVRVLLDAGIRPTQASLDLLTENAAANGDSNKNSSESDAVLHLVQAALYE